MTTAFVFPGQGSHSVGMLGALAAADPAVQQCFAEASEVLGYDLWQRVSEGPAELLNATECQQPAMLVAGVATWRAWKGAGGADPAIVLGHSLGEFTALVASGALAFRTAVGLVQRRGQLMQAAVPPGAGAMAAILGLDDAQVVAGCEEASQGDVVQAVNFNSPGQVVIAGHAGAIDRAIENLKARGAKRAVKLAITVPAHSALLEDAAREFRTSLDAAGLRSPT
ncbi:MAG: ACP S-malonyltransferase, partial [Steroidobacteraceae bacterium]